MAGHRRALPHNLIGFVDFKARLFQVLHHSLGELLPQVIGYALLEEPAQAGDNVLRIPPDTTSGSKQ